MSASPFQVTLDNYTDEPFTWPVLVDIVQGNRLAVLRRSRVRQSDYAATMDVVRRRWATVPDYIRARFLHWSTELVDGKLAARTAPAGASEYRALYSNDFEYYTEEGVSHACLWSGRPLTKEEVEEELDKALPGQERVWFTNPVERQTVPQVWHAQVFHKGPPASPAPDPEVPEPAEHPSAANGIAKRLD
eukprot:m51a1_g190 hypothetical protein (190) ;mRNA; f:608300-608922